MVGATLARGPTESRDFSSMDPGAQKELPQPGPEDGRNSHHPNPGPHGHC